MSIAILFDLGGHRPAVTCDTCGGDITDPGMAVVLYDPYQTDPITPWFAHKGNCERDAYYRYREERHGKPTWMEFTLWMAQLLNACGLDETRLRQSLEHNHWVYAP
jgi:hypothetical protein